MKIVNKNAEIEINISKDGTVEFWNPYNREWVDKP
jgi:hypothetical protein